jgi:hypothetical protein
MDFFRSGDRGDEHRARTRGRLRRITTACLVVTLVSVVIQSASASANSKDPYVSGGLDHLSAVSCVTALDCTAVGWYYASPQGDQTLVETWDGTTWSVVPSPNEEGNNYLLGVSCVSPTECMAVGKFDRTTGIGPYLDQDLVESWNGSSWTIVNAPTEGSDVNEDLYGVSCVSATDCVAVGYYVATAGNVSTNETLTALWDGSEWSLMTSPDAGVLNAVSCTSDAGLCMAVGEGNQGYAIAEMWNGTGAWSDATTYDGTWTESLLSVSCTSDSSCMAVGLATYVWTWDGTVWTSVATPYNGFRYTQFDGISCSDTTACEAVGTANNGGETPFQTVVDWWDGSSWSTESSPDPSYVDELWGASCGDATDCMAVGATTDSTLTESWNGSTVSAVASPNDGVFLSPTSGPKGTTVAVSGGGFDPGEQIVVTYETGYNAPKPTAVTLCDAAASTDGLFSCSGTIPKSRTRKDEFHLVTATGATSNITMSLSFVLTKAKK